MAKIRTYDVSGKKYPSVTSVVGIKDKGEGLLIWACKLGYAESRRVLGESASRGSRVHKLVDQLVTHQIAELSDRDDPVLHYLDSISSVLRELGCRRVASEKLVWSDRLGYAGTLDMVALVDGNLTLVDWKTSNAIRPEYALQTVAYMAAWNEMFPDRPISHRMVVRLAKDGVYEVRRYTDHFGDFKGFCGALDLYRWTYHKELTV